MNLCYYRQRIIIALLTIQLALPILSTDIYLPSLTDISRYMNASLDQVQFTLTAYFFTFGLIQLIYGPLSDRFGRKVMLLSSISIYIIASFLCAFSTSITMSIINRCLQACGAGSAILTFAIVRDLYQGEKVSKMIAYMSAVVALSPIIAPILGGYTQVYLSWHWSFLLLALIGLCILILSYYFLPETNQYKDKSYFLRNAFKNYSNLLSDTNYMAHALSAAFAFAALFAYVSEAPYVLLNLMYYTPDIFGWLFAGAAIGYILGAFINGTWVTKFGSRFMSYLGACSLLFGGLIMVIGNYLYPNSIVLLLLPQFICEFGISIVVSSMVAMALQPIPHCAGAGSALIGFFRFLLATLCSYLVIAFHDRSALPLTLTILGCAVLSALCLVYALRINHFLPNPLIKSANAIPSDVCG